MIQPALGQPLTCNISLDRLFLRSQTCSISCFFVQDIIQRTAAAAAAAESELWYVMLARARACAAAAVAADRAHAGVALLRFLKFCSIRCLAE